MKEVEKAPAEERVAYDFSGPENAGVNKNSASSAPSAITKKAASSPIEDRTTVYLSCGHVDYGDNSLEFPAKEYYYFFLRNIDKLLYGAYNKSTNSCNLGFARPLYKSLTGKSMPSGTAGTKKFNNLMKKYGIAETSGSGAIPTAGKTTYKKCYKEYGSKIDRLIDKINTFYTKNSLSSDKAVVKQQFKKWQAQTNEELSKVNNGRISGERVFKIASQAGGSYAGRIDECAINYETMRAVKAVLKSAGYKVLVSKSSAGTRRLNNGEAYTNRNISEVANASGAAIHICLHWDSGMTGVNVFYADSFGEKKTSKKAAEAMKKAGAKTIKSTDAYSTLNWGRIPTMLVECGCMNNDDYGKLYSPDEKKRAKNMLMWAKENKKIFIDAIKAIED